MFNPVNLPSCFKENGNDRVPTLTERKLYTRSSWYSKMKRKVICNVRIGYAYCGVRMINARQSDNDKYNSIPLLCDIIIYLIFWEFVYLKFLNITTECLLLVEMPAESLHPIRANLMRETLSEVHEDSQNSKSHLFVRKLHCLISNMLHCLVSRLWSDSQIQKMTIGYYWDAELTSSALAIHHLRGWGAPNSHKLARRKGVHFVGIANLSAREQGIAAVSDASPEEEYCRFANSATYIPRAPGMPRERKNNQCVHGRMSAGRRSTGRKRNWDSELPLKN